MKTSPLLLLTLITVAVMGMAHYLALEFYLYWQYSWFDNPMHILGGVVIAFSFLMLPSLGLRIPDRYLSFVPVLAIVLVVGLLWEIFEIWAGIILFEDGFERDMIKDLLMDILGGALGYFVGSRLNSLEYV